MSALWADPSNSYAADRESEAERPSRPRVIEGGAGTARLGRVPFVLALIVILGVGMAGLLALNTSLQGQAFEARSLTKKANQLTYQEASLHTQVSQLQSSDSLAARAFKLGMRPDPNPGFIELGSGKVVGKARTVTGHEVPMIIKTPEQINAERKAKQAKLQAEKAKKQAAEARKEADNPKSGKPGTQKADQQKSDQKQTNTKQNDGGQG